MLQAERGVLRVKTNEALIAAGKQDKSDVKFHPFLVNGSTLRNNNRNQTMPSPGHWVIIPGYLDERKTLQKDQSLLLSKSPRKEGLLCRL